METTRRVFTVLAVIVALSSILLQQLEKHGERFYIFQPTQLHELALRALDAHGNDTGAVVSYIVDELHATEQKGRINLEQEWIFNNAGGAMGAMYIIHASK